jgi:hypothetical protein
MKKLTYALITLTFTFACLSLWSMLTVLINVAAHGSMLLPGFTRFCLAGRPLLLMLPVPVVVYCLYVIFRRPPNGQSSATFLAWTMSTLCLVFFPVLIAVFLPCLKLMER